MPVLVVGGLKTFRRCCTAVFGYVSVLELRYHGFSLGAKSNVLRIGGCFKEVRRQLMGVSSLLGGHTQLRAPLPLDRLFFFFKNFLCVWVFCLHVYLCTTCMRKPEECVSPLRLALQTVVADVGAGDQTRVL